MRLYWPNIGFEQHVDRFLTGIVDIEAWSVIWPFGEGWEHLQEYIGDTCIAKTTMKNPYMGIEVIQTDYAVPGTDALIRRYAIRGNGDSKGYGMVFYGMFTGSMGNPRSTMFDFDTDSMIFYKNGCYIAVSSDSEITEFQIGNDAFNAASQRRLAGLDNIGMMNEGAFYTKIVPPDGNGTTVIRIYTSISDTLEGVRALVRELKGMDEDVVYAKTLSYWANCIDKATPVNTGDEKLDSLYKRSVLYFLLMSDERWGGILASPEVDEENTRCGKYAFCWGRDAAFITRAIDQCGLHHIVDKFYNWALRTQDADGSWHQRYYIDGNLAPSWGLQVDETGSLVWGMLQHYYAVKDIGFLINMWNSVIKAVEFMLAFIDEDTGLPKPSFDIWEERYGEHAYSAAAVYGGITAGAKIARILGKPAYLAEHWDKAALGIREALVRNLWREERKCFIRSIKVKLNPWGEEHSGNKTIVPYNSKGYYKEVTMEDPTIDASMLGVTEPFDVFPADDPKVVSTAFRIEEVLFCPGAGGIMRYQGDGYMGGNPWVITTLWMALFHIKRGDYSRALNYLYWASGTATETGLLPEQADRNSGKPCWVFGLTWSHAMFVLVLMELVKANVLPKA